MHSVLAVAACVQLVHSTLAAARCVLLVCAICGPAGWVAYDSSLRNCTLPGPANAACAEACVRAEPGGGLGEPLVRLQGLQTMACCSGAHERLVGELCSPFNLSGDNADVGTWLRRNVLGHVAAPQRSGHAAALATLMPQPSLPSLPPPAGLCRRGTAGHHLFAAGNPGGQGRHAERQHSRLCAAPRAAVGELGGQASFIVDLLKGLLHCAARGAAVGERRWHGDGGTVGRQGGVAGSALVAGCRRRACMRGLSRLLILITTPCLVDAPTAASSSWIGGHERGPLP